MNVTIPQLNRITLTAEMVNEHFDVTTPQSATSTSTNCGNRGGRPREWTDDRTRRLTRLYVYTVLPLKDILTVIEEKAWSPGKEAANKILSGALGKDPRWMRPKNVEEQRQRVDGLKKSERGRKRGASAPEPCCNQLDAVFMNFPPTDTETVEDILVGRSNSDTSRLPCFPAIDTEYLDGTILGRSSASFKNTDVSSATVSDAGAFNSQNARVNFAQANFAQNDFAPVATPQTTFNLGQHSNSSRSTINMFLREGYSRQGTAMTNSTDYTIGSHSEAFGTMRAKLRNVPNTSDMKDIFRVFKRFTISNENDSYPPQTYPQSVPRQRQPSANAFGGVRRQPTVLADSQSLAGDLLDVSSLVNHLAFVSGTMHRSDSCVCQSHTLDLHFKDAYGNTAFHHYAAAYGHENILFQTLLEASGRPDLPICEQNTSGQTLLHVLNEAWFSEVRESQFDCLLETLNGAKFNFHTTDVYGRTFFHIMAQNLGRDHARVRSISHKFGGDQERVRRRDAFGNLGGQPVALFRATTMPPVQEERQPSRLEIPILNNTEQATRLLETITDASAIPSIEYPPTGGNALHCLAEVIVDTRFMPAEAQVPCIRPCKRKIDDKDEIIESAPLSYRLQCLETVLQAGVDVNHYNSKGDTVLMKFIFQISDGKEDKDLEQIIQTLVVKKHANLEARNRNGETALHVAARLGQKFPVKVLAALGANIYARNAEGLGVLPVIDRHYHSAAAVKDNKLLARLEACRAVITGRFAGEQPVQHPTAEQEWSFRPSTLPISSTRA